MDLKAQSLNSVKTNPLSDRGFAMTHKCSQSLLTKVSAAKEGRSVPRSDRDPAASRRFKAPFPAFIEKHLMKAPYLFTFHLLTCALPIGQVVTLAEEKAPTAQNPSAVAALEALQREEAELRKQEESLLLAARKKKDAPAKTGVPRKGETLLTKQPSSPSPAPAIVAAKPGRTVSSPASSPKTSAQKPPAPPKSRAASTDPKRAAATVSSPKTGPVTAPRPPTQVSRPAVPPAPVKPVRDPRDAEITLLRERIAALTTRNRQVEAELETAQRQLLISETEVERLNEFLNEQGRAYLDRASGDPAPARTLPSRPLRNPANAPSRFDPRDSSRVGRLPGMRPSPAGSLEADRDAPIATIVVADAAGREEPSRSAAVIDKLPEGARVTVERRSGEWYRVLSPQGFRVWIAATDLSFSNPGGATSGQKEERSSAPSILPPAKGPVSQGGGSSQQGRAEDRALELLRQSMGKGK